MNKRPRFFRFTARDQMIFAKRLSMMLRARVSILHALEMMRDESSGASSRFVYQSLTDDLASGKSLHASMRAAGVFSALAINMVRVGESSGSLVENLAYLAEEMRRAHTIRAKVVGALVYPLVIIAATIGLSLSITLYIFPKITPVFRSMNQKLPLSTRIVIALSDALIQHWFLIIMVALCAIVACAYLMRMSRVRMYAEHILMRMPIVGDISRAYNLANISRTLYIMQNGGVQIVEAIEITRESTRNLLYRGALVSLSHTLARGASIAPVMRKHPHLFPPLYTQLISVGQESSDLPGSLSYLALLYEEELNDLTARMTTLLEPLLMIAMGIIVGFIAVAIITPIYSITQNLNQYH
jgi:type II secretory pathway component PulF